MKSLDDHVAHCKIFTAIIRKGSFFVANLQKRISTSVKCKYDFEQTTNLIKTNNELVEHLNRVFGLILADFFINNSKLLFGNKYKLTYYDLCVFENVIIFLKKSRS